MNNVKKDIRFRVYVAFTCICLMGLAIIMKAAHIQITEGAHLRSIARDMHTRTDTMYAERGNIYTEDGHLLCSSIPQFDIYLDLTVIKKDTFNKYIDTLSSGIAAIIRDQPASFYKAAITQAYNQQKRYFRLCRNLAYDQFQAMRVLPIFNKGKRRGGFIPDPHIKRINPYGLLAYRTIGLWRENAQLVGLEGTYDSVLAGENGSRILEKMSGGVMMPLEGSEIEPHDGRDLVTTLDLSIQNVAEHALKSVLEQYQCLNGCAIVMEVSTGKIRAMVNLGRQDDGSYTEDYNYCLMRAEPGSTFKLITLLSLLNDGYITVKDMVNCEGGQHQFPGRVMNDSHHGLGTMPICEAYAHSSNVAMAKLAYEHYAKDPEKYMRHLEDLGIDKKTGIDLQGEVAPMVIKPGKEGWNATTLPWMATGYGIYINPLRTCMMYNAVANGGRLMKPYLVSGIQENGRLVKTFGPTTINEHIGDSTVIAQLDTCTKDVVLLGTGRSIRSPYYNINGKTGTAQVADRIHDKWYGYKDGVYQGSFVGYFPSEAPKYTVMVMIRTKPHAGTYFGGLLAAPVFRMIADKIFSTGIGSWAGPIDSIAAHSTKTLTAQKTTGACYSQILRITGMNIQGLNDGSVISQLHADSSHNIQVLPTSVVSGVVPDVTGMSLRDAVYLIENSGMRVRLQGKGRITSQSPAAGTKATKGQTIFLQLS